MVLYQDKPKECVFGGFFVVLLLFCLFFVFLFFCFFSLFGFFYGFSLGFSRVSRVLYVLFF